MLSKAGSHLNSAAIVQKSSGDQYYKILVLPEAKCHNITAIFDALFEAQNELAFANLHHHYVKVQVVYR